MIIRYVIGTLLIVIPVGIGLYFLIREFTQKELFEMGVAFIGFIAIIVGICLLTS